MNLPTFTSPPPKTATAVQLAERLGRPVKQVKDRLARDGAPKPIGVLVTSGEHGGGWPRLYPAELATEWLEKTADGELLYDVAPDGTVTVGDLSRRYGLGQSAIKKRLQDPAAPADVGRLRASGHPRLYVLTDVEAFFREKAGLVEVDGMLTARRYLR